MNTKVVAIFVVVMILAVGSVLYVVSLKLQGASTGNTSVSFTTSAGSGSSIQFLNDSLTVGFQSGLWQITIRNTGITGISLITVYLLTPVESKLCGGTTADAGLAFINCQLELPGNPFPPGTVLTGTGSGIGEGSAKVGSVYPVGAQLTFSNGTIKWVNTTVTASSPS